MAQREIPTAGHINTLCLVTALKVAFVLRFIQLRDKMAHDHEMYCRHLERCPVTDTKG